MLAANTLSAPLQTLCYVRIDILLQVAHMRRRWLTEGPPGWREAEDYGERCPSGTGTGPYLWAGHLPQIAT